jgi:hypothetical protein
MKSKLKPGNYILFWLGTWRQVEVTNSNCGDVFFTTRTGMIHPIEDAAGAEFFPTWSETFRDDFNAQRTLIDHPAIRQVGIDPVWKWIALTGWITVAILVALSVTK